MWQINLASQLVNSQVDLINSFNLHTMESSQIPGGNQHVVTVAAFASKYRSKNEIYSFLTLEVQCYLPAPHTLTVYFLKDLVSG